MNGVRKAMKERDKRREKKKQFFIHLICGCVYRNPKSV